MGVFRLWSYINSHKDEAITYVDLVELAKSYPGKMNILVDFYCWEHFVRDKFLHSIEDFSEIDYILYAGGEYKLLEDCMKCMITELRSVNIEPIFFLDGAKGSAYFSTKQKLQTWRQRFYESQNNLKNTFSYLRGEIASHQFSIHRLARPCLQEVQNVLTLQEMGCTLYLRVSGEADVMIAKYLCENQQAYGVFSNDTDFAVFPDSVFLPQEFFDLNSELGLELRSFRPRVPKNLVCGVVRTENIVKLLKLRDHKSLIEFAIVSGNDFTQPYLKKYPKFKNYYAGQTEMLSAMINECVCVENCEFFGEIMKVDVDFRDAVYHSRQFYNLTLPDEEEPQTGFIFNLIADDIRQGKIPSTIVAMHQGIYWHRQILEDPASDMPVAEEALSSLRAYIYKILLPHHKAYAMETGRTLHHLFAETKVYKASDDQIPSLAQVKRNSFSCNLGLFEFIIQHQEIGAIDISRSYFKQYGLRIGFICFLLRYFLILNWNRNLYISPEEFCVLVAWTMGKHDVPHYYKLKMFPGTRCVTMESWFQALYRTAYAFLGNILELSHEFPSPKDLFSSSTWVALYTACSISFQNPHYRQRPPLNIPIAEMMRVRRVALDIVKSYRGIAENVVQGIFPLDSRLLQ